MRTRPGILFLLVAVLSGCSSLSYYSQAVGGHVEVMLAARSIDDLIRDPASDPKLKSKLEEVRRIRDFASRELGLPDNGSYRSYADLGRPFVTWNVFAAPEFSLQTENWCMLIVGCVGYRGFYDKKEAEVLAKALRRAGFDTYVGGVTAYSTLGYFSDPVLNTFLTSGNLGVARVIFHELAHQLIFVEGDTVFNESFATAVENEGMRRWLAERNAPDLSRSAASFHDHETSFVGLVTRYRAVLNAIYHSTMSIDAKSAAKAETLAELKSEYLKLARAEGGPPAYKQWLETDLNNAKIASLALYTQLLPAFTALLEIDDHDLPGFYRRVRVLAGLPYAERQAAMKQLLPDKTRATRAAANADATPGPLAPLP